MSDSKTKKNDSKGTEKAGDYYMLHNDGSKYSREEIMAKTMPCKEGVTNRFAADPHSDDFIDKMTSRRVYARNDAIVPQLVAKAMKPKVVSKRGAALAQAMQDSRRMVVHSEVKAFL